MVRIIAAMILVCALSACDTTRSLQSLRHVAPQGSAFQQALAQEYRNYAESELKAYDWWSSKYFADKGMVAAYGKGVEAERPSDWNITGSEKEELASAREQLIAKLTSDYVSRQPEAAAKTQMAYDCWIEQQDENDEEGVAGCKQQFKQLMGEAAREAVAMGGPLSTSYLLNFAWDSKEIEGIAYDELRDMAGTLKQHENFQVVINGHADSSGGDDYNMELSQERADVVREFLMGQGISEDHIVYYAFGESDPKVPTEDGVRNRANRRVEIFIE